MPWLSAVSRPPTRPFVFSTSARLRTTSAKHGQNDGVQYTGEDLCVVFCPLRQIEIVFCSKGSMICLEGRSPLFLLNPCRDNRTKIMLHPMLLCQIIVSSIELASQ